MRFVTQHEHNTCPSCDAVSFHADGRACLCAFVRAKHKTCVNTSLRLVGEKHDSQRIRHRLKEQQIEMQRLQQLFHLGLAPNSSEEAISCDEGVAVALWCRLCSRPGARRWFVEDDLRSVKSFAWHVVPY